MLEGDDGGDPLRHPGTYPPCYVPRPSCLLGVGHARKLATRLLGDVIWGLRSRAVLDSHACSALYALLAIFPIGRWIQDEIPKRVDRGRQRIVNKCLERRLLEVRVSDWNLLLSNLL